MRTHTSGSWENVLLRFFNLYVNLSFPGALLCFFVSTQFSFHLLPRHLSICQFLFVSVQILDCGQSLSCRTSNCTHGQHFIWPQAKKIQLRSPAHTLFYLYLCTLYQQRHYSTNFLLSGVKNCVCQ